MVIFLSETRSSLCIDTTLLQLYSSQIAIFISEIEYLKQVFLRVADSGLGSYNLFDICPNIAMGGPKRREYSKKHLWFSLCKVLRCWSLKDSAVWHQNHHNECIVVCWCVKMTRKFGKSKSTFTLMRSLHGNTSNEHLLMVSQKIWEIKRSACSNNSVWGKATEILPASFPGSETSQQSFRIFI